MKKLLLIILLSISLNSYAVNPTQGPLQQDPSLCNYGYNSNCNRRTPVHTETIIRHKRINVPSKYGALAINRKTGISGGSLNADSKQAAIQDAIRTCEQGGSNAPCKVVTWVRNGCIAASQGKSGNKWKKFYEAGKPGEIEQTVLYRCQNSGASDCKIFVSEGCSVPDGMYD